MKNYIRIVSLLLTALLLLGSMTVLSTIGVYAAEETTEDPKEEETTTGDDDSEKDDISSADQLEAKVESYKTTVYATPEDKIATMGKPKLEKGDYQLYVDEFSGEIALKNTVTKEILFSNPYDIGTSKANESEGQTKEELLSQIIVNFTSNGTSNEFYSFTEAAARNQIVVKNIKNGIRVQYTIGREQSKMLLPRVIEKSEFEAILEVMRSNISNDAKQAREDEFKINDKFFSYYTLYDTSTMKSETQKNDIYKKYPVTKTKGMAIYVFDPTASDVELTKCEDILKTFNPDYTYEMLDEHHAQTEYVAEDLNPPLFKMALEYTIDDNGLSVRLPANGIRFNESLYQLDSIEILPFMGAGNNAYEGYNVFPDGSGATFDYQDLNIDISKNVNGKIYGKDFAYHSVTGQYQKSITYPVFGAVEETTYYTYSFTDADGQAQEITVNGSIVDKYNSGTYTSNDFNTRIDEIKVGNRKLSDIINSASFEKVVDKRGFMAIIEDGEALTEISTNHPGTTSEYNSLQVRVTPRPTDTYKISGSLSVNAENSEYTVVCDRKYVGSYKIRYVLLSDYNDVKEADEPEYDCYDTSWFGMAVAYRDYLMSDEVGILTPLSSEQLTDQIPLYIESFGALETVERVMSIPVKKMTALTTFEDIETMYEDLSNGGVKNVNFKLTGYANGGLEETVPYKFNIESAVGGEKGFQELLDYAAEINKNEDQNMGIFPNFDFAYAKWQSYFDGLSPRKHLAKTIDDRYASRKEYSATQGTISYYDLAISPAYYSRFYEKIKENYLEEFSNVYGISVGTLGTALNSDFDEDEPYNREDSKNYTKKAFAHFDENYSQVMTDGGNAYSWQYVDHILGVALDSSRYNISAESIPFIGIVLHGSIQFAGSAMNMEGNMDYAMLKALENGASPYFILSYRNTQNLKESSYFSKYYSVRYDIWKDDLIDTYNKLNDALYDVQDKFIIGHEKIEGGVRVPDLDEIEADILAGLKDFAYNKEHANQIELEESAFAVSIAREMCRKLLDEAEQLYDIVYNIYDMIIANPDSSFTSYNTLVYRYNNYKTAYDKLEAVKEYEKYENSSDSTEQAKYKEYTSALQAANQALNTYLIGQSGIFMSQTVVRVDGEPYAAGQINDLVEKMYKKLETAIDYIDVIAAFENADVVYEEGKEGDIFAVLNVDELPRFTKKAVEQVRSAYKSLTSKVFMESTTPVSLSGDEMRKFPKYNDAGVIEDADVKETYYAFKIGAETYAFTGTSISNYRFFQIVDVASSYTMTDAAGKKISPISYEGSSVILVPMAPELVSGSETVYRDIRNNGTWYYFEKNADGSITYCLPEGSGYTRIQPVEYTGDAIISGNTKIFVLKNEAGETLVDGNGDTIYVSGTDHNSFKTYILGNALSDIVADFNAKIDKIVEDTVALGQITAEEFYEKIQIKESDDEDDEDDTDKTYNKYATSGIVAVTYGTLEGEAYKTMLLNYNNYAVNITYNGNNYTIPAYGFVVIKL